jgi:hypothetical protein
MVVIKVKMERKKKLCIRVVVEKKVDNGIKIMKKKEDK